MNVYKLLSDQLQIYIYSISRKYNLQNSSVILNSSVNYKTEDNVTIYDLVFPSYIEYINNGRKADSKLPPFNAILNWAKTKGIPSDNSTIWAIRQSIAKFGIAARPILDELFDTIDKDMVNNWLDKIFNNLLKELDGYFHK